MSNAEKPTCPSCRIALVGEDLPVPAEVEKRFHCKTCGYMFEVRAVGGPRGQSGNTPGPG